MVGWVVPVAIVTRIVRVTVTLVWVVTPVVITAAIVIVSNVVITVVIIAATVASIGTCDTRRPRPRAR